MCNSYNIDTYVFIIPPDIASKVLDESGEVFLRECPCRLKKGNCRQEESKVCLLFADAAQEDLKETKPISKAQAFSILEKTRNRGDINHLFYRKDNKKITEICSCCTCCCSILEDMATDGDFTHFKKSGYFVETDHEKCILCSECIDNCFFGARSIVDDEIVLDEKLCFGCERCSHFCPEEAIDLQSDKAIRIPDDL
ncbi:MAG: hypothetical protein GY729_15430 [Desulfobacteraceae bacterium]|nr:hypothetical protein [Desulfobacteraceae bacterium]